MTVIWREPPTAAPPALTPGADVLSEAGAALRFARLHGYEVRWDHRADRWLVWRGHRLMPDTDGAITRLSLDFARAWQTEAVALPIGAPDREAALKFALRLERRDAMANMLTLAKAMKPIANAGDEWDADPWVLGVSNGVIDLRTGALRPGQSG